MDNEIKNREAKLSDYIYILYKWKKFIIINVLIVGILTTIIAFLFPNQYKATATVMVPPNDQMGLGGLTSLLGGKSSIASAGSRLFGVSNTSEDLLLGIIKSRTALTKVIKNFNLMQYYDINDKNIDKAIKAFREDILADPNEFGMIEFSIINKDPNVSAKIANYLVTLVDSMNIELNIQRAKNNRLYIEKRYLQNVSDLKRAEDSLYKFQKKYGIVAVPEQLEVTVKAAAEIESELTKKELQSYFVLDRFGENSPQNKQIQTEIKLLKQKVQQLKNSTTLSSSSNTLFAFKDMPIIAIQYLRAYREVQIQQSILEIVMPMYEQAKVEEQKSMPTIIILDEAVPPQLKDSPKRALIVLIVGFLVFFILITLIFVGERSTSLNQYRNPLEEKSARFYRKVIRFYRMKF